jgi:hypothetical protein
MDKSVRRVTIGIFLWVSLLLGGCTSAVAVFPEAQSRVIYPHDWVMPIGEGRASTTWYDLTFSGLPDFIDPQLGQEAVREAIRSRQGDLLTDYALSLHLTQLSSPFNITIFSYQLFPTFWIIRWTAEGTVAKVMDEAEAQRSAQLAGEGPQPAGGRP